MIFKKHLAKIENGTIQFASKSILHDDIIKYEGEDVWVVVRPVKNDITPSQRGYYFGVVVRILADATGYSKSEMHQELKRTYHINSISNMNTEEMADYIKTIREDFSEYNIPESYEVEFS